MDKAAIVARIKYAYALLLAAIAIAIAVYWVLADFLAMSRLTPFANGTEITLHHTDGLVFVAVEKMRGGVASDASADPNTRCTAEDSGGNATALEPRFGPVHDMNAAVARIPRGLSGTTVRITCTGDYRTLLLGPEVSMGGVLLGVLWGAILPVALIALAIVIAIRTSDRQIAERYDG